MTYHRAWICERCGHGQKFQDNMTDKLVEARQQNEHLSDELERVVRCTDECERRQAEAQQEIDRLREQVDAMRGKDLAGLEHIEYCDLCGRFFDSREGCSTDIRADEREKVEAAWAARTPQEPT